MVQTLRALARTALWVSLLALSEPAVAQELLVGSEVALANSSIVPSEKALSMPNATALGNTGRSLVVWMDERPRDPQSRSAIVFGRVTRRYSVFGTFIDEEGEVSTPGGRLLVRNLSLAQKPQVAGASFGFVLMNSTKNRLSTQFFDSNGEPFTQAPGYLSATTSRRARINCGGACFATWEEKSTGGLGLASVSPSAVNLLSLLPPPKKLQTLILQLPWLALPTVAVPTTRRS